MWVGVGGKFYNSSEMTVPCNGDDYPRRLNVPQPVLTVANVNSIVLRVTMLSCSSSRRIFSHVRPFKAMTGSRPAVSLRSMLGDKKCPASTDIKRHIVPLVHRAYPICGKNLNPELQQVPTEPSSDANVYFMTVDMAVYPRHQARLCPAYAEATMLGSIRSHVPYLRRRKSVDASFLHISPMIMLKYYYPFSRVALDLSFGEPSYDFIFDNCYAGVVTTARTLDRKPKYIKLETPSLTVNHSFRNEGHLPINLDLIHDIDEDETVTVLTPYLAQKHFLRRKLCNIERNLPVLVRTIDEYQGGEAQNIIFSLPNVRLPRRPV
ncbi:hypothetical protein L596_017150 [Steinernema carpocapsae]|uniref:DNA2/NAM7 helicase-like C-terminal domain-containing protein n=1 Tax=Steinernema carpocapsae TaxID=34508 RepID=A0A4U5N119_STECR|nr:hypothetical protein L596_017150 [Steinernema carpocapsae]